jgi:hypothetical protein
LTGFNNDFVYDEWDYQSFVGLPDSGTVKVSGGSISADTALGKLKDKSLLGNWIAET